MTSIYLDFKAIDDATGIVNNQSIPAGGGKLALNGNTVVNGIAKTGSDAYVSFQIVSTENLSGINFTITGKEVSGLTRTEVLVGPNAGTVTSGSWFQEISAVSVDGAIAANIQIGWKTTGLEVFSGPILVNSRQSPFNMHISATNVGSGTTSEFVGGFTLLDPQGDYSPNSFSEASDPPFTISTLNGITGSALAIIDAPITALFFTFGVGEVGDHWTVQILQGQNG